ncbi:hypothetical protein [Streptomyces sp. MN13]
MALHAVDTVDVWEAALYGLADTAEQFADRDLDLVPHGLTGMSSTR